MVVVVVVVVVVVAGAVAAVAAVVAVVAVVVVLLLLVVVVVVEAGSLETSACWEVQVAARARHQPESRDSLGTTFVKLRVPTVDPFKGVPKSPFEGSEERPTAV